MLFCVANAHHCFLDLVGRVFPDHQTRLRRHQKGNAPRLPQLQGAYRIFVDEGVFNGGVIRLEPSHNIGQLLVKRQQPSRQIFANRVANTVRNVTESAAFGVNHAPSHVPQTGIDSQNPHILSNCSCFVAFLNH
jgi:hypothetical protein